MADPRQDRQAERQVLGAVLMGGVDVWDAVQATGIKAEHFYEPRHEALWRACARLAARGEALDATALLSSLSAEERRAVGHPNYVAEIITEAHGRPGSEVWAARSITDAAVLRALQQASVQIGQWADVAPLDARREAIERARGVLDQVELPEERESISSAEDLLPEVLDAMETPGQRGIATGLVELDDCLGGGFSQGQTIIFGARPSVGKTMLGCNLVAAACRREVPTMIFSHEMTKQELMQRFLALESGVRLSWIRSGQLGEDEWSKIARATDRISRWPLLIDDESTMTVADYRARLRKATRRRKVGLVVADYLQLIKPFDQRVPREQQVAGISSASKALSKDFKVPMVLLAQLSRATEQRKDSRPVLSDLRESGSIENDADVVVLMHQEEEGRMWLDVAKNRQGERDRFEINWWPMVMRAASIGRDPA